MQTHPEPHVSNAGTKLNWLRASVLGADDGIVSVAGLVVGVAGAISMAAGEYVSVSSSRDSEKALLKKEQEELQKYPEQELLELAAIYEHKGLTKKTAMIVAEELTAHDPVAAHFDAELGIDPNNLTNPWHAAFASAFSFLAGAAIPMIAIVIPPPPARVPVTFLSVIIALAITGFISARIGKASVIRATIRVVSGGALAMVVTFGIGRLFGV